jgi:hypothetical protein
MGNELFREGGPHNIRRTGRDKYEMSVSIPKGQDGMTARECTDMSCLPGYFRVKGGTGITEGQVAAFCPYCRRSGKPGEFHTKDQLKYAKQIVEKEAIAGVGEMLRDSLGLGSSGSKRIGGGLLSIDISVKAPTPRPVARPIEEELRRDVTCPHCGLEHSVFGLASWCPDCGADIFLTHVDEEFVAIRKMLAATENRRAELGARVAARDIENALEDTVSIFEAVMKIVARRLAAKQGMKADGIEALMKEIGNAFQNLDRSVKEFQKHFQIQPFAGIEAGEILEARAVLEKRHPITHNLGIIDRKYLERVRSGELEGREVRITPREVEQAIEFCRKVLWRLYSEVFELSPPPVSMQCSVISRGDKVPGLGVSPTAQQLASFLCERSETGASYNPMIEIDNLQKELELKREDLEEAIDELRDRGLVGYDAAGDFIFPENRLFWYLDPVVKKWRAEEDARVLAEILINEGQNGMPMTKFEEKLGWLVRRLNPAATFLKEEGVVDAWDEMGQPYECAGLMPTVKTRRFLKGEP